MKINDSKRDHGGEQRDPPGRRDASLPGVADVRQNAAPRQFFRPRFRVRPAEQERDFVRGYN